MGTQSAPCLTGSTFLLQVLSEPWSLSTSQIPQFQICMFDPKQYPNHLGAGGGFGPVSPPGGWRLAALGPWSFSLGVQGLHQHQVTRERAFYLECKNSRVRGPIHSVCLAREALP